MTVFDQTEGGLIKNLAYFHAAQAPIQYPVLFDRALTAVLQEPD